MRRMKATPWIKTRPCGTKSEVVDLELEKFDTDKRSTVHVLTKKYWDYVSYVKKFFHTDDPDELVKRAWRSEVLPVWCEKDQTISLVDSNSGEAIDSVIGSVIASELKTALKLIKQLEE